MRPPHRVHADSLGDGVLPSKHIQVEKLISWTALLCSVSVVIALTIAH